MYDINTYSHVCRENLRLSWVLSFSCWPRRWDNPWRTMSHDLSRCQSCIRGVCYLGGWACFCHAPVIIFESDRGSDVMRNKQQVKQRAVKQYLTRVFWHFVVTPRRLEITTLNYHIQLWSLHPSAIWPSPSLCLSCTVMYLLPSWYFVYFCIFVTIKWLSSSNQF